MISQELRDLLHRAVALANPSSSFSHPLDERRLIEFFDACNEQGIEVTHKLIDENWPDKGIVGLGGDPAKSDKVRNGAYRVLTQWKKSRR